MTLAVHPELVTDRAAIREVNRLAFGRDDEGGLVDALRDGGFARLSLVAERDGLVVGHILFSALPIETESGIIPALALAPMAVIPAQRRQGIGSSLVREGLRICAAGGHGIVVVLGHPGFYRRFGFSSKLAERLKAPFAGDAFMALELRMGSLDRVEGTVHYPPPFSTI